MRSIHDDCYRLCRLILKKALRNGYSSEPKFKKKRIKASLTPTNMVVRVESVVKQTMLCGQRSAAQRRVSVV